MRENRASCGYLGGQNTISLCCRLLVTKTLQAEYRNLLKAFYSVLKSQDRYIKLAFLTGVTKFGKVSVFSDLNNLNDISMDYRYMDICGITDKELHEKTLMAMWHYWVKGTA